MALVGTEVLSALAPDAAGHPAAVPLNFTTAALLTSGLPNELAAGALTAAGTTRADALALTAQLNSVDTVAASTGVVLPAAVAGQIITVFNNGANALKVYAAGSDTIDGTAGSTGVTLTNALRCAYICCAAGKWLSAKLGATST